MSGLYSGIAVGVLGAYSGSQDKTSSSSGSSIGGSRSSSKSELTMMDALSKSYLDKFTGGLSEQVAGQVAFDPKAAAESASGVVKSIFDAYQKTALPKIANMSNRGGSYDSTTHQLLANDAFARATAEASDTVLKTVQEQQKIKINQDNMQMQQLYQALGLEAQVTQKQKQKSNSLQIGATSGTASTPGNWASGLVSGIGSGLSVYSGLQP